MFTTTAECGRGVAKICTIFTCTVAQRASERESGNKARWYFTISGCLFFVSLFCTLKKEYVQMNFSELVHI